MLAIVITIFLVLWMASGVMQAQEIPDEKIKQDIPIAKVKVETILAQRLHDATELYSRTEPDRIVRLKTETAGKVEKCWPKIGAMVKKGQIIAKIAMNDLASKLSRSKVLLAQLEIEYGGAKKVLLCVFHVTAILKIRHSN